MTVARSRPVPSQAPDTLDQRLRALFEGEAASRTPTQDAALLDSAIRAAAAAQPLGTERRRLAAALGYGFPDAA